MAPRTRNRKPVSSYTEPDDDDILLASQPDSPPPEVKSESDADTVKHEPSDNDSASSDSEPEEDNAYEKLRQENIRRNAELLRQLNLQNAAANLKALSAAPASKPAKRSRSPGSSRAKRVKREYENVPRRTSSRLARKPAEELELIADNKLGRVSEAKEMEKRGRVAGDLSFEIKRGLLDGVEEEWREDTGITEEEVRGTTDKTLREVRERFMGLRLWDQWEPNKIKITPERIYSMEFHPTKDKPLIIAGDKVGNIGILDASVENTTNEDDEDAGPATPDITNLKPHTRTIPSFIFSPTSPNLLFTAAYDGSIRQLDLTTGKSNEVAVIQDYAFSSVQMLDPHTLLFSTLEGLVGRTDIRTKPEEMVTWDNCSEKKIGGLAVNPKNPNMFATASLDRTVKLWDLRNASENSPPVCLAEHHSPLSVSSVSFSPCGTRFATASYDDTVKIHTLPSDTLHHDFFASYAPPEEPMVLEPSKVIRHNNQTGRWVTILRAVWQEKPKDGVNKLVIANMNQGIDVFGEGGEVLAHLRGEGKVTAVPAVARLHRSREWVVGGTGSGKVVFFK